MITVTKFNIGDKVITGYGSIGIIKSIKIDENKENKYLVSSDNTEDWHNEQNLDIIIDDKYLTE